MREEPDDCEIFDATLAEKPTVSASPPKPPARAVTKRPPPLPFAKKPAADARDRLDESEEASSESKPAAGFPVFPILAIGGGLLVGAIAGVLMWKLGGDEQKPASQAIAQKAPQKDGEDPAAIVPVKDTESKAGNELPQKQEKEPAVVLAKEKDTPQKQDKEPAAVVAAKEKESKSDKAAPAKPRTYDLLSIVDLDTDIVEGKGKWRRQDQKLICEVGHFVPRVQVRYVPPEEYDFTVTFSQSKLRHGVMLLMPKPGTAGGMFVWTVGCRTGGGYGFGPEGKDRGGNSPKLIQTNTTYTTTVQVRQGSVKGLLDGRVLVDYPTDFRDFTIDGWRKMPIDRVLGIACDDPTIFQRVQITEITGAGKAIR